MHCRSVTNRAAFCSKLQHPNVVDFIGANMRPPKLCFVMELCEMSLYDVIHKTNQEFSRRQQCNMALGVANALNYLHTLKPQIIHRDIKSMNILLADNGELKICDFGLVRWECGPVAVLA